MNPPDLQTPEIGRLSFRTSRRALQASSGGSRGPLRSTAPPLTLTAVGLLLVACLAVVAARGLALPLVAVSIAVAIPFIAARTRWATALALAPALLYPLNALNSAGDATVTYIGLILALYLLTTVLVLRLARHHAIHPDRAALTSLLILVGAGLIESAYTGNGTLHHSITTGIFWLGAFLLGSLVADDRNQFAALGLLGVPLAGLAFWQTATGSNPYNHLLGRLHFENVETYHGLQRATSTFGHPLVAGASLTILAFSVTVGRNRFAIPVSLIVLLGAVTTVSRSALIGALVALLVALIVGTARRRTFVICISIVVAVVLAAVALPSLSSSLEGRILTQPYKQVARVAGPQKLLSELLSDPLAIAFGSGVGSTQRELAAKGGTSGVDTYDNQYVDTIFDVGLVPFGLALYFLLSSILAAHRSRQRTFLPMVASGLVMLLFFDGLGWPSFAVLFWFMLGALTSDPSTTIETQTTQLLRRGSQKPTDSTRSLPTAPHVHA